MSTPDAAAGLAAEAGSNATRGTGAGELREALLAAWYLSISAMIVARFGGSGFGIDATNYLGATRAWLAGADPWTAHFGGFYFAAPPPTLLVMLPFAALPEPLGWWALMASGPLAIVGALRVLRLPWWWAAFPPLVIAAWVGNPATWIPLLLATRFAPVAVLAKTYAVLPLVILGRWREIALVALAGVLSLPVLPWGTFLADWPHISRILAEQTQGGLVQGPLLAVTVVLAILLVIVDRERGAWLAVTAWPNAQWSYYVQAMPAGMLACAILAMPVPWAPVVALLVSLAGSLAARRSPRTALFVEPRPAAPR